MSETPLIPEGPFEVEPRVPHIGKETARELITDALTAAGVRLGAYDRLIVEWQAGWDGSSVVPLVSWLRQAAARVAELEAERHSTNEALDDAAKALRADRDRIAGLEAELRIGPLWKCPACSKENRRDVCVICETDRPEPRERTVDEDPIAYALTAEADGITRRIAPTQALREDGPAALEPRPIVKATSARYAEKLRRNPGKASADGHTGWECGAGASLIVRAETPGPGKLGTHHGVIYACTEHQAAAVERIESAGYGPKVDPAPAGHRWDPWPCGHVTSFNAAALAALSGQRAAVADLLTLAPADRSDAEYDPVFGTIRLELTATPEQWVAWQKALKVDLARTTNRGSCVTSHATWRGVHVVICCWWTRPETGGEDR